jgi:hypothetical protein
MMHLGGRLQWMCRKVLFKLNDELVVPSCTGVAEVQVMYALGLRALLGDISFSAASAFQNADIISE